MCVCVCGLVLCSDNILDDKPEGKSTAEKEEPPTDEVPKRSSKKPERAANCKGKVGQRKLRESDCMNITPLGSDMLGCKGGCLPH